MASPRGTPWWQAALGVLLLAALLVGVWLLLSSFVRSVLRLDKEVAAAIIAASGTLIVAVLSIVLTNRSNKLRELAEAQRPEKMKVYASYMEFIFELLKSTKKKDPADLATSLPEDFQERWLDFKRGLIGWASPDVIKELIAMEDVGTENPQKALTQFDRVLREMRRDLGVSNRGLAPGQLIQVFLTPDARKELSG